MAHQESTREFLRKQCGKNIPFCHLDENISTLFGRWGGYQSLNKKKSTLCWFCIPGAPLVVHGATKRSDRDYQQIQALYTRSAGIRRAVQESGLF